MSEMTLGFIGLGTMGLPMAVNLLKSGCPVLGYNRSAPARERFAALGGLAADSIDEIYARCGIVFLCLPTNDAVISQVQGLTERCAAETVSVDMGSTAPHIIRTLSGKAAEKGMALLDCPVSGGLPGAEAGTLSIMCGGEETVFLQIQPYLRTMGTSVVYMGASGCGSTAKLANNMMVGAHLSAMAESYAFAAKAGIEPRRLFDAIHGGFAQSAVMDAKVPKILERDFRATARIEIHMKDLKNALALADALQVELPLTSLVMDQMNWLAAHDLAKEDQCAMAKVYEAAMDVEIR